MDPLVQAALDVRKNAYVRYSGYRVGAALEDEQGRVFTGVNVENLSYGATICAERSAVTRMVTEGGRHIKRIAVASKDGVTPCGMCLQVLSEFATPDTQVIRISEDGKTSQRTFGELFPWPFKSNAVNQAHS